VVFDDLAAFGHDAGIAVGKTERITAGQVPEVTPVVAERMMLGQGPAGISSIAISRIVAAMARR